MTYAHAYIRPLSLASVHFHPEKYISLLSYGGELYYTNSLRILVRRICVVKFLTATQKKNRFSRINLAAPEFYLLRISGDRFKPVTLTGIAISTRIV